ncbi:hypothetical protein V8E36_006970 [Tilletia maclaganii]
MFSRTWAGRALRWPSSQLTTPTPTTTATTHPPIATLGPSAPAARRPAAMTRRRVAQTKWLVFLFICPPVRQGELPIFSLHTPRLPGHQAGAQSATSAAAVASGFTNCRAGAWFSHLYHAHELALASLLHAQHGDARLLEFHQAPRRPQVMEPAAASTDPGSFCSTRRSLGNDLFAVGHRLLRLRPAPADPMKTLSSRRSEICSTLQHERDGS